MKRVLALLSLVCALLLASACHYDVNLSVEASTELTYYQGAPVRIGPQTYSGFHRKSLSNDDLEWVFTELTKHADREFQTAMLYLSVFDEISGKHLREETYGVVYNTHTGHYDFADMDIVY